jgi:hypothetical protein
MREIVLATDSPPLSIRTYLILVEVVLQLLVLRIVLVHPISVRSVRGFGSSCAASIPHALRSAELNDEDVDIAFKPLPESRVVFVADQMATRENVPVTGSPEVVDDIKHVVPQQVQKLLVHHPRMDLAYILGVNPGSARSPA